MDNVPHFLRDMLDAMIGGPARGFVNREDVMLEYLELLRTQPGLTAEMAFELAYYRALEARKEEKAA